MRSFRARTGPHRLSRRFLPTALAAVAATASLAGCSAATVPGRAVTSGQVSVTVVPAPGAAGLYIAADDGLFAKAGLNVTISSTASASDTVQALDSGKTDVVLGQWTTAIEAEAAGSRL